MFGPCDAPIRFGSNPETASSTKDLYRNAALHSGVGAKVRATAGQLDGIAKVWFAMPLWTALPRVVK